MRFALVIAAVGLVLALGSCDFNEAWEEYCSHAGRCAALDGNITVGTKGSRQIAQGDPATYRATLHGSYLYGAEISINPPNAAVTLVDAGRDAIELDVKVSHGAAVGDVNLSIDFSDETDPITVAPFIRVTPIVVADAGNNSSGLGTYDFPYATLARANQHADGGDTIHALRGQYASVYPNASALCTDTSLGLKPGVSVVGELETDGGITRIVGERSPGKCAFNLFDPAQDVSQLTIEDFSVGILASGMDAGMARTTVSNVRILECTNGVTALRSSRLLLQDVFIERSSAATQSGLVVDEGDVVMQRGRIFNLVGPSVLLVGDGGVAVLENVTVQRGGGGNSGSAPASEAERFAGTAIVLASNGGRLLIDGGFINDTRFDGIAVFPSRNTVELDGTRINSTFPYNRGIAVRGDGGAVIRLRNIQLTADAVTETIGIYVEGAFAEFNGGARDGGSWGNNILGTPGMNYLEIHDARTVAGQPMEFAGVQVRGVFPPDGSTLIGPGYDASYGIRVDGPNFIQF